MSSCALGAIVFACVFGAALLAMRLRAGLPGHHLSADTKDTVKLAMGLVASIQTSQRPVKTDSYLPACTSPKVLAKKANLPDARMKTDTSLLELAISKRLLRRWPSRRARLGAALCRDFAFPKH
jgi:hypothetical protein